MPITLKKDAWNVKDPTSGSYRGAAILSTTLPEDATQIIEDTQNALDVEEARAEQIINNTQNTVDGIEAQSSLILENISKAIHNGTDKTLTVEGMPADAEACGELKINLDQIICKEINDGNYILKCTINNGVISYIWEPEN